METDNPKNILLKPIDGKEANKVIKRLHYSGKVVHNSQLHIGVFYNGRLEGALQFGPSLDKRKIQGLVSDTKWHEFIELNRMAFSDKLPRNSESRALAVSMKLIAKYAPQIKWVITFADATQCGDGTIYRASGFILTQIKDNYNLARLKNGTVIHKMTLESSPTAKKDFLGGRSYSDIMNGKNDWRTFCKIIDAELLPGFQLRYLYFIDKSYKDKLTVPIIPYSEIKIRGAAMYKGQKTCACNVDGSISGIQPEGSGSNPTHAL